MSIAKRGRRNIIVNEKNYVWYIKPDNDSPYYILNIISEDKKFIISCPLKTNTAYIINKGTFFQNKQTNGLWERYLLPFPIPEIITPNNQGQARAKPSGFSDIRCPAIRGQQSESGEHCTIHISGNA